MHMHLLVSYIAWLSFLKAQNCSCDKMCWGHSCFFCPVHVFFFFKHQTPYLKISVIFQHLTSLSSWAFILLMHLFSALYCICFLLSFSCAVPHCPVMRTPCTEWMLCSCVCDDRDHTIALKAGRGLMVYSSEGL